MLPVGLEVTEMLQVGQRDRPGQMSTRRAGGEPLERLPERPHGAFSPFRAPQQQLVEHLAVPV
jgi:hypothetical protein